jgi:hypothetical protein
MQRDFVSIRNYMLICVYTPGEVVLSKISREFLNKLIAGVTGFSPPQEIRPPSQKGGESPRNIAPL